MAHSILIVDDSITLRQQLAGVLEREGYEVSDADDASRALDLMRDQSFDLLIVDVNMPGMSGIEMVAEARKLERYATTPIFILTAESTNDTVKAGRCAGATAWIIKPFKPEVIIKGVKRILENGRVSHG